MAVLREKVSPLVAAVEASNNLPGMLTHHTVRTDPVGGIVLECLPDIALVGALDEDDRARSAVCRVLAAVPEAESLGPRDSYSIGFASCGSLQIAYDLTVAHLPGAVRDAFTRWTLDIGIRAVLGALDARHALRSVGQNVAIVGIISALLSLLTIEGDPGVPELTDERRRLLRYFEGALFAACGPNGYPAEDIGYGNGMAGLLARTVEATRRAGLYDAYRQCPHYARFGRAMLHFVQPWGTILSNTGDYGADFGYRNFALLRLATETADPALLWLLETLSFPLAAAYPQDLSDRRTIFPEFSLHTGMQVPVDVYTLFALDDLREPVHPSKLDIPTQFMDPSRGIVSLRSSWRPDATFVVFDGAHRPSTAQGHAHDSGGHFSLSALGEYFAIDTGRYSIEQEHHNVVLVDGKSGHSGDGRWRNSFYQAHLTGYAPGTFVDYAAVDSSQMSSCYWAKRHLALVKGRRAPAYLWTVEDVNADNDYHEFRWTMNVHPDSRIQLHEQFATIEGATHGNLLDLHFALPAADAYPKPHTLTLAQDIMLAGSQNEYGGNQHELAEAYRRLVGRLEFGPVYEPAPHRQNRGLQRALHVDYAAAAERRGAGGGGTTAGDGERARCAHHLPARRRHRDLGLRSLPAGSG